MIRHDLFIFTVLLCTEPMLPLFVRERKKYLADMKAKKAAERYATSDPSSVLHRKIKRRDIVGKADGGAGSSTMDVDHVEVAGDGELVEQSESLKHKKI